MSWKILPLKKLASFDRTSLLPEQIQTGTKYVGLEHISGDGKILDYQQVENGDLASSKFKFDERHILYGKLRPYLKKIARPDFKGVCSTDIIPILVGANLDKNYLHHYLRLQEIVDLATARSTGVNLPRISPKILEEFEIPLPPLDEQKRIAEVLDCADALREKRRRALQKLDTLLQSVFLEMFGDPVKNPKGFEKKKLGDVIKVKSGEFLPTKDFNENGQFPVFGGNGISGYHNEYMFDEPQIVIGRVGAYCGSVHLTNGKIWVTDNALFLSEKSNTLEQIYLFHALTYANFNQYAGRFAQPLISGSRIYPVSILIPPSDLQTKFSEIVSKVKALRLRKSKASEIAENLFQSLQQKAFKGELFNSDSTDELNDEKKVWQQTSLF